LLLGCDLITVPVGRKGRYGPVKEDRRNSKGVLRMSRLFAWTAIAVVAVSLCVVAQGVVAQNPSPAPAGRAAPVQTIALLDVAYVFKNHNRFQAMNEEIQNDVKRFQAEVTVEKNAIGQLNERLQQFHPGMPEYKSLDDEITKRKVALTARHEVQMKEFMRRQMKTWCSAYKEVCDATDAYVQQHAIDMVVRFNGDPVDPEQPDSVKEFVGRQIVSYRSNLDITPEILKSLNRSGANRAAAVPTQGQRR
jgi:Skp family chaperone for outer membrane proteins